MNPDDTPSKEAVALLQQQLKASRELNQELASANASLTTKLAKLNSALQELGGSDTTSSASTISGTTKPDTTQMNQQITSWQDQTLVLREECTKWKGKYEHLASSIQSESSIWRKYESLVREMDRYKTREAEHWKVVGAGAVKHRAFIGSGSVIIPDSHLPLSSSSSSIASMTLEHKEDVACQTEVIDTSHDHTLDVLTSLLKEYEVANVRLKKRLDKALSTGEDGCDSGSSSYEDTLSRLGDNSLTSVSPNRSPQSNPVPVIITSYNGAKSNAIEIQSPQLLSPQRVETIPAVLQVYLNAALNAYKNIQRRMMGADMFSMRQSLDSRFSLAELTSLSSSILDNIIAEIEDIELPFIAFNSAGEEEGLREECMYIAQSTTLLLQNTLIDGCKMRMILNQLALHLETGGNESDPVRTIHPTSNGHGNWSMRRMFSLFSMKGVKK